jgi:hypothetical protein
MLKLTRRGLIKQASIGAGAVGVLAAAVAAKTSFESSSTTRAAEKSVLTPGEALVVYINNSATDTLTVLRGERATTVTDAALVQHLLSL